METYIVRIYRKEEGTRESVVGLVENVDSEETRGFRSKDELWKILNQEGELDTLHSAHKESGRKGEPS